MHYWKRLVTIVFIIEILLLGYVFLFSRYGYVRIHGLQEQTRALDEKIDEVSTTVSDLKTRLQQWKEDEFYSEKMARESLALIRPGEKVVKIVDSL